MKTCIYKARVEFLDDHKIRITSYANRRMGMMVYELNKAVQDVRRVYNGESAWKKLFVHFEHDGVKYRQVEADKYCEGCVFKYNKNGYGCQHPHYLDGSKGDCTGRIYVKDE